MSLDEAGKPPALICYRENADGSKDRKANAQLPTQYSWMKPDNQYRLWVPPGAIGWIYNLCLATSPRPVPAISMATAVSILGGIAGRAFNVKGQGLNQYVLIVASTGSGKDVAQSFPEVLFSALRNRVPVIDDFRGPGELVSGPGLLKWLSRQTTALCAVGEIGILLQQMAKVNANSNMSGLERMLLQLYSKSGRKGVHGASAYSDKEQVVSVIYRPSLAIVGETTPEFYKHLDDDIIASGLLPRFMVFEYLGEQVALAKGFDQYQPDHQVLGWLADIVATVATLNKENQICDVGLTPDAEAMFDAYEHYARFSTNATASENIKHLWSRAHMKALKLAATCAVGINWNCPVIDFNCAEWAIGVVTHQTRSLVGRVESGDVGRQVNDEDKQTEDVIRQISNYIHDPVDEAKKYGGVTDEMHRQNVITISNLQRRVLKLASFRKDRMGATYALNRVLKSLLEGDELREIPKVQMQTSFGTLSRGFCVANPARFLKAPNGK